MTLGQGNDVYFNTLPQYVADRPLYSWVQVNTAEFIQKKSIFTCPTAVADGIDPKDINPSDMNATSRPLFSYGMNSKSTANESTATRDRQA